VASPAEIQTPPQFVEDYQIAFFRDNNLPADLEATGHGFFVALF
jgi:hypothetical protein